MESRIRRDRGRARGDRPIARRGALRRRHVGHPAGARRRRGAAGRCADVQRREPGRGRHRADRGNRARDQRGARTDQRPRQGDGPAGAKAKPHRPSGGLGRIAPLRSPRQRRQQRAQDRLRSARRALVGMDRARRLRRQAPARDRRARRHDRPDHGGRRQRLRPPPAGPHRRRNDGRMRVLSRDRRERGGRRSHGARDDADPETSFQPADLRAGIRRLQPSHSRHVACGRRLEHRGRSVARPFHCGRNGGADAAPQPGYADRTQLLSAGEGWRTVPDRGSGFRPARRTRTLRPHDILSGPARRNRGRRGARLPAPRRTWRAKTPFGSQRRRGARNAAWTEIRAARLGVPMLEAIADEAAYGAAILARSAR